MVSFFRLSEGERPLSRLQKGLLFSLYRYANMYKTQVFQIAFKDSLKKVSLPQDYYETTPGQYGQFEQNFLACVTRILLLMNNYEKDVTAIPIFGAQMDCYNSNNLCKKLIAVFAEDLMIDEHLRNYNFTTNYY